MCGKGGVLISLRYPNPVHTTATYASNTVADPGEGPGGPGAPLMFKQNWCPKGQKIFLGVRPSPLPHPPYLKVWIWRCNSSTISLLQVKSRKITLCYFICNSLRRLLTLPTPSPHPFVPYERLVVPQLLEVTQYPLDGKVRGRMLCYASYSFSHCVSRMYSWEWSVRREFSLFGKASHLTTSALDRTLSSHLYSLNSFKGWQDNTMVPHPLCRPTPRLSLVD